MGLFWRLWAGGPPAADAKVHHVVIVGTGFGGLESAFRLAGAPVRITLIDQRNHTGRQRGNSPPSWTVEVIQYRPPGLE